MESTEIVVYSDGGARGNPGPGACAFVVSVAGKQMVKKSKYLGRVTNNFAEYSGVSFAFDWLSENKNLIDNADAITFYLDSELVVKQLIGLYRVKNESLRKIYKEVKTKIENLQRAVLFKNIPRSKNKTADLLVNMELDKNV